MFALMAGDLLSRTAFCSSRAANNRGQIRPTRRRSDTARRRCTTAWSSSDSSDPSDSPAAVLARAADGARGALEQHGLGPVGRSAHSGGTTAQTSVSRAGPLGTYATLLAELDGLVVALHDAGQAEWARQSRRQLRRDLAAAAAIEAALVEDTSGP
jgi:hypothetical protein